MPFSDYSTIPGSNTQLSDDTFIGPNMPRDNVRPALQQLAADGKDLFDYVIAANGGDDLPSFIQAGVGAVATPVQTKLRRMQVDLEDFGGGTGVTDNTAAFIAALAALQTAGGGVLQIGRGNYNLASATLTTTGIEIPPNVTIQGVSRQGSTLTITGTAECVLFTNDLCSSNHLIRDLRIVGNSKATVNGTGGVYLCRVLDGTATASVRNCIGENLRLENFGGDAWFFFWCSSDTYTIDECGLRNISALTFDGNARDPNSIGVLSSILEFKGTDPGQCNDCFARNISAELSWVKIGVLCFGNVNRVMIDGCDLRNAFQGESVADKAAYAIICYDIDGNVRDAKITNCTITNPFSCGIYLAGTIGTQMANIHVSGQEDTADGTLPKGGISINGAVEWSLDNYTARDNYCHLATVGPSADVNGYAYAADAGAVVSNMSGKRATDYGISIKPSATKASSGGIKFTGCKVLDSGDTGVAIFPTTTQAIANIEFIGCEVGGANYGYNFNRGAAASHSSTRIVIDGGSVVEGATESIKGLGFNTGGTVKITGVEFSAASTIHIDLPAVDALVVTNNVFRGAASTGNMFLDGSEGVLRGNVAANGSTMVVSGTASLGRAAPTWTGYNGVYVENAVPGLTGTTPNAYRLKGWGWLTGTTWYEDRTGLQ